MLSIKDILSGDITNYPKETQEIIKLFSEELRERLIEQLIINTANDMLKDIEKGKDNFIETLGTILRNGCKGLNVMSTQSLLDLYLERKNQEDFIRLIEEVNDTVFTPQE